MTAQQSTYDAVVLGAGLGGLIAGAILAKKGCKVLLLEEEDHPGGASTVIPCEGFPFLRTPVLLLGLEKNGTCDQIFSGLGLSLQMLKRRGKLLKRPAPFLQVVTESYRINLETSRNAQLSEYKREWGADLSAFERFYDDLDAADRLLYPLFCQRDLSRSSRSLRDRFSTLRQTLKQKRILFPYRRVTAQDGLLRYHFPPSALHFFETLSWFWHGVDLRRASFLKFRLQQLLSAREVIRPVGGLVKFCEELAKTFTENRGVLFYQQPVASISRDGRRGWVVETVKGKRLQTRRLIVHYPWERMVPNDCGTLTYFFTVDAQTIPASMCEQVLVHCNQGSDPFPECLLLLVLSLPEEEKSLIEPKRLLAVTLLRPPLQMPSEQERRHWLHEVIRCLHWLMPFSEGKIQYRGSSERALQSRANRLRAADLLTGRLRKSPHAAFETAAQSRDRSLYFLPDRSASPALPAEEIRSADVMAGQILKDSRRF